ncbi:probable ubiquitin carboxyl-terminal hydrolase MINDY-4 [Lagopus leucura]|nr:probable ubiquitin carboxyl-terminal hydrolase MINDY-4 [Lagopus leucura]
MAIADILWRAGSNEKAVVALPSGRQQFTPIGKYKADGILETLILHSATRYEDLIVLLQQNIHQFEIGPCGCILLTVSVILSRSINL